MPIDYLNLELRDEDRFAAEVMGHISDQATVEIVDQQIANRREFRKLVENGLDAPICPELTNANPGSAHTVIAEAFAWALAQQRYSINQIPRQNLIAFANLFGVEPRAATAAVTTLEFTVAPPADTDVTIPAGTEVQTDDGRFVFQTAEDLVIVYGDESGTVSAVRTVAGHTLLSANVLTRLIDTPAYVETVTNPSAVDSGLEPEPLDETLDRVRRYQRRGERIVTSRDLEEAILDEGLEGNGIVRVFPFVANGDFVSGTRSVGHTTAVVMTRTGETIDADASLRIAKLIDQVVGSEFVYVVDPEFVDFDVQATVRLVDNTLSSGVAVQTAIEKNLRAFYAAARERFGAPIYRSEIIAVIEGTPGVDRIESDGTNILDAPLVDTRLAEYQIAKLVNVTIGVF